MRILLSCPDKHAGVKTYLSQLREVTSPHTVFYPIEELISFCPDYEKLNIKVPKGKRILKMLSILKLSKILKSFGDNIILGSWKPYYPEIIKRLNKLNIKPTILWTSTLGQSEMTWGIELKPLNRILELLKKRAIRYFLVLEKTYQSFSNIKNVNYLSYPVDMSTCLDYDEMNLQGNNVDLFLQFRPGKNTLQQMVAQRYTKTKFYLHTNIKEETILDIAKKLNLSFILHRWLPKKKYYGLIKNMDVSLQVTWTESFNYAVCERMILGVPSLVSSEVFLINNDEFLRKYLVVETPDSPLAIAEKIDFLLSSKNLKNEIAERGKEQIKKIAQRYNKETIDQLDNLFD